MTRLAKAGNRTGHRFVTLLQSAAPLLIVLAGCAGDNRRGPDPLLGGPIAGPAALPPPSSAGSTAALASGSSRPPEARSGLQIGSSPPPAALVTAGPGTPVLRPP